MVQSTSALYCLPAELAYQWHHQHGIAIGKLDMLLHVLAANCGIKVYSG